MNAERRRDVSVAVSWFTWTDCCRGFSCRFIKMKAAICTEMSELLLRAQAFSRAGGQRFVLGEDQEIGLRLSANLQWVLVRASCNCLPLFEWPVVICVTGGCWNHCHRVCDCGSDSAPPLEVCGNVLCVFVGIEADYIFLNQYAYLWCCFIRSWKCLETTAGDHGASVQGLYRPRTFTTLSRF